MSKYAQNQIVKLEKFVTEEAAKAAAAQSITLDAYVEIRQQFNIDVVHAIIGAELDEAKKNKDGTHKIKANHGLPTPSQVAKIASIVEKYIEDVEDVYFGKELEDGAVREQKGPFVGQYETVDKTIFFQEMYKALLNRIGCMDVFNLYAIAEKYKKNRIKKIALIAAGSVLVLAGGVVAYKFLNGGKKEKEEEIVVDDDLDDEIIDIDIMEDDDLPIIDVDDEELPPVVEIADE
jgi:hypothetical protein